MSDNHTHERFLPVAAVVDRTSFSRATLYEKVKTGDFPRPIKLSANRIAWAESAVAGWIAGKMGGAA